MVIATVINVEDLLDEYRTLYWQVNEFQIINTPAAIEEATKLSTRLRQIEKQLGYVPSA